MKPYYEADGITLYHGDCREVVPLIGTVDLILTDPPYGDTSLTWDRVVPGWPALVRPKLAPSGALWCFTSLRSFLLAAPDFTQWRLAQDVVWEKHNGSSFHADRFKRVHEHVVQWYPLGARWLEVYKAPVFVPEATARTVRRKSRRKSRPPHLGHIDAGHYISEDGGPKLMRSVIYARSCHGYAEHPTQKPAAVLAPLIEYSCPPGGIVLDLFAGSGSTLVTARALGRGAIGIEINEADCETSARRLEQGVLAFGGVA